MHDIDVILCEDMTKPVVLVEVDDNGCWFLLVTGRAGTSARKKPMADGYVEMNVPGGRRSLRAHCVMYETFVGPIPPHAQLDHLCRVRACCNPDHVEPVTPRENTLRGQGIGAINAVKTHCVNGHEFTPENTYIRPDDGGRSCRKCGVIRANKYRKRTMT